MASLERMPRCKFCTFCQVYTSRDNNQILPNNTSEHRTCKLHALNLIKTWRYICILTNILTYLFNDRKQSDGQFLHKSCRFLLFYFILLQMGELWPWPLTSFCQSQFTTQNWQHASSSDNKTTAPVLLLQFTGCLTDQQVRFPGDIFTKIQQNLQFYRHLPGRVTNPWDHTDPVYPSNSSVKGLLPGIDSLNIN